MPGQKPDGDALPDRHRLEARPAARALAPASAAAESAADPVAGYLRPALIAGLVVGGLVGSLLLLAWLVVLCAGATAAIPYGQGLAEHRQ